MKESYLVFCMLILLASGILIVQIWKKIRKLRGCDNEASLDEQDVRYILQRIHVLLAVWAVGGGAALIKAFAELIRGA